MTVIVSTDKIFFDGDHLTGTYIPGEYTVEMRAWTVNNIDTSEFIDLIVEIVDPCVSQTFSIDSTSTVFKNND